jgi:hypothetical protein
MYKVRKNKKANFNIYETCTYNIEDENIDKAASYVAWKDIEEIEKEHIINNFIDRLSKVYTTLERDYIRDFVYSNKGRIKYDKIKKKIIDIYEMEFTNKNNKKILHIKNKKTNSNKNSNLSKLRKSLTKKRIEF